LTPVNCDAPAAFSVCPCPARRQRRRQRQTVLRDPPASSAARRTVKVGARNATEAWIEAGLEPGERVIVHPGDSVAEGARIDVVRGRVK
jgi:HlyD family secretion protein